MQIDMKRFNTDPDYQYLLKTELLYYAVQEEITEPQKLILLELLRDQLQRCKNHCQKNYEQIKREIAQDSYKKKERFPIWMKDYQHRKLELFSYELPILSKIYQFYLGCFPEKKITNILDLNIHLDLFFKYRRYVQIYMKINYKRILSQEKQADHTVYQEAKQFASLIFDVPFSKTNQNQEPVKNQGKRKKQVVSSSYQSLI